MSEEPDERDVDEIQEYVEKWLGEQGYRWLAYRIALEEMEEQGDE